MMKLELLSQQQLQSGVRPSGSGVTQGNDIICVCVEEEGE